MPEMVELVTMERCSCSYENDRLAALSSYARDSIVTQQVASFIRCWYIRLWYHNHNQRGLHLPSYLLRACCGDVFHDTYIYIYMTSLRSQRELRARLSVCSRTRFIPENRAESYKSTYGVLNMLVGDWIIFFNNCTISLYIVPPRVRGRNMFLWWQSVCCFVDVASLAFSIVNIGL